jgi:very-short-patch-repair endonuclease
MYFRRKKKRFRKPKSSNSENLFIQLLEEKFNVTINKQFKLLGRFYDGQYDKYLLELDGEYWHGKMKQKKIDWKKDLNALRNGYQVIRIVLNNTKEIPQVFEEHKLLLEKIFK